MPAVGRRALADETRLRSVEWREEELEGAGEGVGHHE